MNKFSEICILYGVNGQDMRQNFQKEYERLSILSLAGQTVDFQEKPMEEF